MATGDFTYIVKQYFGDFTKATFLYLYDDGTVCGRSATEFVAMSLEKKYAPWNEFTMIPKDEMEVQIALGTLLPGRLLNNALVEVWERKK